MSVYFLCRKVTAVQTPPTQANPAQSDANPTYLFAGNPPPSQSFELIINGIGTVSATVQVYASNDDDASSDEWSPYLDPISASGTVVNGVRVIALAGGNQPFRHFTCCVTAISGTNATVDLKMGA